MIVTPIEAGARAICPLLRGLGPWNSRERTEIITQVAAIAMVEALSDEACLDMSDTDRPMSFNPERFRVELIK